MFVNFAGDGLEDIKYSVSNYPRLPFYLNLIDVSPVILLNQQFSRFYCLFSYFLQAPSSS